MVTPIIANSCLRLMSFLLFVDCISQASLVIHKHMPDGAWWF